MTPKEKAEELVKKYEPLLYDGYGDFDGYIVSKQCALICVDEIQEHAQMIETEYEGYNNPYQYFLLVKQEINKL